MATSNSYSTVAKLSAGNFRKRIVDITCGTTYSASGFTLAAADYSALAGQPATQSTTQSLSNIIGFVSEVNLNGARVSLDRTNSKLVVFEAGAQATTTISTGAVRVHVTHSAVNYK